MKYIYGRITGLFSQVRDTLKYDFSPPLWLMKKFNNKMTESSEKKNEIAFLTRSQFSLNI